jgi:Mg2+/Co2+ transporter CorC
MYQLGRMPRRGEGVSFGGFRFKVMQGDRRRLHMLEVERQPAADTAGSAG